MPELENSPHISPMPPEPDGLPGPDDIGKMESDVWRAQERMQSALLTKDRDLAVEAHRVISGDPEADLPEQYDKGTEWRSREEIDAGLTAEQEIAARERVREIHKRLGILDS